jgi:hypothetical protein
MNKEINEILIKKATVRNNLEHNKAQIIFLETQWRFETEPNRRLIERAIRRGKGGMSLQKTEMLTMSAAKISKLTGIPYNEVRNQEATFNKLRPIR